MTGRRRLLRALAAGVAGATAGCNFPSSPMRAVPEAPAYADWLHRPDLARYVPGVDDGTDQRFAFGTARPSRIVERTDDLLAAAGPRWVRDDVVRAYLDRRDVEVLDPRTVDRWVGMQSVATVDGEPAAAEVEGAMAGSFDPAAARRTLVEDDAATASAGTYRGYDFVQLLGRRTVVGFGRGRVLRAVVEPASAGEPDRPPAALLEATIDVLAGERAPAHERDRTLARLVGHLGDGLAVRGRAPPAGQFGDVEGLDGWGASSRAVDDLQQRWVGAFDGDPPGASIERRLRSGYFISLAAVRRPDRMVVARGRVDLPVWLA